MDGTLVSGFLWQSQLQPAAEIVYATRANIPDYLVKNGTSYRIFADHQGSVRLVVNASDGSIAQRLDYDAFGRITYDSNPGFQPFGFASGLYDPQTGLNRFGARDYDPETGRWTSKDPIGFAGGNLGLYSYVDGDSVDSTDPTGLAQLCTRPLAGALAPVSALYPGDSDLLDQINLEPIHQNFWFDDGTNFGFFKRVARPDFGHTRDEYTCKGNKLFDDETLREAIREEIPRSGKYHLTGKKQNNCQDWAYRVQLTYERLRGERLKATGKDPELEYIWQRLLAK